MSLNYSFVRGCLVDLIGIEPMTSSMPWKRAPSCATGPHAAGTTPLLSPLSFDPSITLVRRPGAQFNCPQVCHGYREHLLGVPVSNLIGGNHSDSGFNPGKEFRRPSTFRRRQRIPRRKSKEALTSPCTLRVIPCGNVTEVRIDSVPEVLVLR
jgi:hypothetical protein